MADNFVQQIFNNFFSCSTKFILIYLARSKKKKQTSSKNILFGGGFLFDSFWFFIYHHQHHHSFFGVSVCAFVCMYMMVYIWFLVNEKSENIFLQQTHTHFYHLFLNISLSLCLVVKRWMNEWMKTTMMTKTSTYCRCLDDDEEEEEKNGRTQMWFIKTVRRRRLNNLKTKYCVL